MFHFLFKVALDYFDQYTNFNAHVFFIGNFFHLLKKIHNYLKSNRVSHKACPKPSQILICVQESLSGHTKKNYQREIVRKVPFCDSYSERLAFK